MRGGGSGFGLGGGATLGLTCEWHGRLVADAHSGLSWVGPVVVWLGVSFAPEFRCGCFCGSSCLFCLGLGSDFYVSEIVHLWAGSLPRRPSGWVSGGRGGTGGEGWSTAGWLRPPPPPGDFVAGRPVAALLFWFFGGFRCGIPLFIVMLVIH